MVAPSKLYQYPINQLQCSQIIHINQTCCEYMLSNIFRSLKSSSVYFLPLVVTPLLAKSKAKDLQVVCDVLKYYSILLITSAFQDAAIFFFVCMFRQFHGRFRKYTALSLPTVFGIAASLWTSPRALRLYATATSQATFEALLRYYSNPVTRLLLHSKPVQTLLFMFNSAIILQYKRAKLYKGFWFIQPHNLKTAAHAQSEVDNTPQSTACAHHEESSCSQFFWKGLKKYLPYGISLDLLNIFLKGKKPAQTQTKNVFIKQLARFKSLRLNNTAFFCCYIALYRLTSCLLQKHCRSYTQDLQHLMSAFFAGAAYICLGNFTIYTFSLVLVVQMLWQQFCTDGSLKPAETAPENDENISNTSGKSKLLKFLKQFPFIKIFFPLNVGFLVHAFLYKHHIVNGLARGFINGLTGNETQRIYEHFIHNEEEHILKEGLSKIVRGFI